MARFDEIELQSVPLGIDDDLPPSTDAAPAPRLRRFFALLTDLSLFVALGFALSPLLPASAGIPSLVALGAFVLLVSFYYYTGCWMLWGRTVGGVIFDVRVVPESGDAMSFKAAAIRWAGLVGSLLTGGLGLVPALLPSRASLPDRLSQTRCVSFR